MRVMVLHAHPVAACQVASAHEWHVHERHPRGGDPVQADVGLGARHRHGTISKDDRGPAASTVDGRAVDERRSGDARERGGALEHLVEEAGK